MDAPARPGQARAAGTEMGALTFVRAVTADTPRLPLVTAVIAGLAVFGAWTSASIPSVFPNLLGK